MNQTISAIYENGIIRPLQQVELDNGEELDVILVKKGETNAAETRSILSRIAELPIEGDAESFSGTDHDEILYPKVQ